MNKRNGGHFDFMLVASVGCEITNESGQVIGWAVDVSWAAIIVRALNAANSDGGQAAGFDVAGRPVG